MPTRLFALLALTVALGGCGSLIGATVDKDYEAMQRRLAKGADPEEPDDEGRTPLGIAVNDGDRRQIEMLLVAGAKATTPSEGSSPLERSVARCATGECTALLTFLEHDVDPTDLVDSRGPFLRSVAFISTDRFPHSAGVTKAYFDMLERRGGRSVVDTRPVDLPCVAAINGNADMLSELFRRGVSPNETCEIRQEGLEGQWSLAYMPLLTWYPERTASAISVLRKAGAKETVRKKGKSGGDITRAMNAERAAFDEHNRQSNAELLAQQAESERREQIAEQRQQQAAEYERSVSTPNAWAPPPWTGTVGASTAASDGSGGSGTGSGSLPGASASSSTSTSTTGSTSGSSSASASTTPKNGALDISTPTAKPAPPPAPPPARPKPRVEPPPTAPAPARPLPKPCKTDVPCVVRNR